MYPVGDNKDDCESIACFGGRNGRVGVAEELMAKESLLGADNDEELEAEVSPLRRKSRFHAMHAQRSQ